MIPSVAALYSAFGMFAMDLGRDYARSYVARAASVDLLTMNQLYSAMEREALEAFRAMGVSGGAVTLRRTADLRYIGQFHEVETEMDGGELTRKHIDDTVEAFHRFNIDACCGGSRTIAQAAKEDKADLVALMADLNQIIARREKIDR